MATKKGLGRGLGSLLGELAVEAVENDRRAEEAAALAPAQSDLGLSRQLRIIDVFPNPDQPRKTFDEEALKTLADSIERHGVLQPVAVRAVEGGYVLVAGERRWRAARLAGLDNIPAVILGVDERGAAELSLIENLQREDLNPVEEAMGYKHLAAAYDLNDSEIGEIVGKSRTAISNSLRLLSLEKPVLDMLRAGEIHGGHARALVTLPPTEQTTLAEIIARDELSVRQTEALVKKAQQPEPVQMREPATPEKPKHVEVDWLAELGATLSSKLGRGVKVVAAHGKEGGALHIEYYSTEDLTELADILLAADER